jgi:hypothetical protein
MDKRHVRRWASRYRWITLAELALAFLAITAATAVHPGAATTSAPPGR